MVKCFIPSCGKRLSSLYNLRVHLTTKHNYDIPHRISRIWYLSNDSYTYTKTGPADASIKGCCSCPCCAEHFEQADELKQHFEAVHPVCLPPLQQQQQQQYDTSGRRSSFRRAEQLRHEELQQQQQKENNQSDHIHLALALMSILLLSPDHYADDIKPFFDRDDFNATVGRIHRMYSIVKQPIPTSTVTSFLGIVDDLLMEVVILEITLQRCAYTTEITTREQAEAQLNSLTLPAQEHKVAKALSALVSKLPRVALEEEMNEVELCARFVDPFLCGLFDDPDDGLHFRWTNETTLEAKKQPDLLKHRPDMCITKSCELKWNSSHGYREAKPACQGNNHYLVCRDLVQVAAFCRNAMDSQDMKGVLGIQVVGRTITFYVLVLPATGLYIMLELTKIKIPNCLHDLPKLITDTSALLRVLDVFHRVCVQTNPDPLHPKRSIPETVSTPLFNQIFSTCQDRKRQCHLHSYHN
ncbi:hypothetical protein DFQ29_009869 [Apophysomyces sp. BC1021]|nr:hypothetical protein DFQ29_009869 [Apophysomyces sp. BC1021]